MKLRRFVVPDGVVVQNKSVLKLPSERDDNWVESLAYRPYRLVTNHVIDPLHL